MPELSTALTPYYICQICHKTIQVDSTPIIGEAPAQKLGRIASAIMKHFTDEHRQEVVQFTLSSQQWVFWLVVNAVKHNNPDLMMESEKVRMMMRKATKRMDISDEAICSQIDKHLDLLQNSATVRDVVIKIVKSLRDSMDEIQPDPQPAKIGG